MKVYAHYLKCSDSENEYRWRTLLQFGISWQVIGSAVMKNPGSAAPLRKVHDESTLDELYAFSTESDWFEFDADITMHCIREIFENYYHTENLNGVVQIFNLMNVRDPNLEMALKRNNRTNHPFSVTTVMDAENLIPPVYLGWGSLGSNPLFAENARYIFRKVIQNDCAGYLNSKFESNPFLHPLYLMRYGKDRPTSQDLLKAFCHRIESQR